MRAGARTGAGLVAGCVLLVGCGGGASKLSGSDRSATAGVCVNVSGQVATAVSVGVKLASQSITSAQAQTKLTPIQAKVQASATQNPTLPIGSKLQALADAINTARTSGADPSKLRSSATAIGSAAKGVVDACAAVTQ